jgi:excisionase family DNA binding protein
MQNFLTVRQAAERASVCASVVYAWVAAGMLPHFRLGMPGRKGSIRIAEADLDAFLASQRREGRKESAPPPQPLKLKHLQL